MAFLQRSWLQVKAFFAQLTPERRTNLILIGVVLAGAMFLVYLYAGAPERTPLPPVAEEQQAAVVNQLRARQITVTQEAGQLLVPPAQYNLAVAVLAENGSLAADTSRAFDELVSGQSSWTTNEQSRQRMIIAKQKTLGGVISKMRGVRAAQVLIDLPQKRGFGDTHVLPVASVNVVMESGKQVDRALVGAVAHLLSGAVSRLRPQDVSVIDANLGQHFTVDSEDQQAPTRTFEMVKAREDYYRRKIEQTLRYIPGVIVAVNVQTDSILRKQTLERQFEQSEPLRFSYTRETERTDLRDAGEPGARSNAGTSIAGSGGQTHRETTAEQRDEFQPKNLVLESQIQQAGQQTLRINVTVNVPRRYFVGVWRQDVTDPEAAAPTPEQLASVVQAEVQQIEQQVQPLIEAEAQGTVRAHMIPDPTALLAAMGLSQQESWWGGEMLGSAPTYVIALSMLALGLMFWLYHSAMQRDVLPSVEELAGVPPELAGDEDIIGEAAETDATMAGVEIDESEIEARKIAEQISELIKTSPNEAANLFNRWIKHEEY